MRGKKRERMRGKKTEHAQDTKCPSAWQREEKSLPNHLILSHFHHSSFSGCFYGRKANSWLGSLLIHAHMCRQQSITSKPPLSLGLCTSLPPPRSSVSSKLDVDTVDKEKPERLLRMEEGVSGRESFSGGLLGVFGDDVSDLGDRSVHSRVSREFE